MKTIVLMLVVLLMVAPAFAAEEATSQPTPPASVVTTEEISVLRAEIAELRAALAVLQTTQPERKISIGVMPIANAGMIPQVGYSFRQVTVSSLCEAGVFAVESLDDETLRWVQRQDQLVRERWISPVSAPLRGELQGVSHLLFATVTRYKEADVEDIKVLFGVLVVRMGGGQRIKTGSLVVDWRLVDTQSGVTLDAFRTEASVQEREWAGGAAANVLVGRQRHVRPLPESAARACARQAAERIAGLLQPALPSLPPVPAPPASPSK